MKYRKITIPIADLAERYAVSTRTVRRWHDKIGDRVTDPRAVAEMLLRTRTPKVEIMRTVHQLISETES